MARRTKAQRQEKREERKENRQERRDKIKDKIKSAANKVGYARLLVFKPVLVQALKKKGAKVSMSTKMDVLVPMFKDVVIDKKAVLNYDDYNCIEHVAEEAADAIVTLVLEFIKNLKAKKDKGEPLSPDEQNILDASEKVAESVKDGAKEAGKDWFFDMWYLWVAVAALLIYFAVKKKK